MIKFFFFPISKSINFRPKIRLVDGNKTVFIAGNNFLGKGLHGDVKDGELQFYSVVEA